MPDLSRDEDGFTEMQRRFLFYYLRDPEESREVGGPGFRPSRWAVSAPKLLRFTHSVPRGV
jgi:hypothetical protein